MICTTGNERKGAERDEPDDDPAEGQEDAALQTAAVHLRRSGNDTVELSAGAVKRLRG
jgi:hypothetical protein